MGKRELYRERYITAALLTILIFILGVALGMIVDNKRLSVVKKMNDVQELNFEDLQLQYLYINTLLGKNKSCDVLQVALEDSIRQLADSLSKVEKYEKETNINKEEYLLIRKKYLLDNLRYWMFAREAKEYCNMSILSILYFFSPNCERCPDQGVILSYYKQIYGNSLLVFPIDSSLKNDIGIVRIIISKYNITKEPSLVIGEKKYEGVVGKEELGSIICESLDKC